jgi:hypothetical protein
MPNLLSGFRRHSLWKASDLETGESGDAAGEEAAPVGDLVDTAVTAADIGGEEGGTATDAGGGKFAATAFDGDEFVFPNGSKTAPFGNEGGLHVREVGLVNFNRFKRGPGARVGTRTGWGFTTTAVVEVLATKRAVSSVASCTGLLAKTEVGGGKKIEYTFFGSREGGETSSRAGKDG